MPYSTLMHCALLLFRNKLCYGTDTDPVTDTITDPGTDPVTDTDTEASCT